MPKGWTVEAEHIRLIAEHLDKVERGEIDRLAIHMPPRHGKSETVTYRFPVRWLQTHPGANVLVTGYNQRFANKFGRRTRNLAKELGMVSGDKAAMDEWETTDGGLLMTRGVGSPPTGTGFNLIVIDDPVRRRQDAESETVRESTWEWYTDDLYQRLEPGGAIVLIMCMTGDTPVLMADGSEKMLRDVRPGDHIATYENGQITTSKVKKWKNQGEDIVFTVEMESGIMVRGNERHPFLVDREGVRQWTRIRNLKPGDQIVKAGYGKAPGKASSALLKTATNQQRARGYAHLTTISTCGQVGTDHHQLTLSQEERLALSTGIVLPSKSTTLCLPHRRGNALFVESRREIMSRPIGLTNSQLIMITTQEKSEDFCATTATGQLDTEGRYGGSCSPLSTYEITHDRVARVFVSGREDVYDIQVDRTENFIANGLVSHNTLWHEDDIGARAVASEPGRWTVLKLPAFALEDDPMGREPGAALWPERYTTADLQRIKDVMVKGDGERSFEALYQQNPTPREGSIFRVSMLEIVGAVPAGLPAVRKWDVAATQDDGDLTAGVKMSGPDKDGLYYVEHCHTGQWESSERNRQMRQTAETDGRGVRIIVPEDPGSAGKDSARMFISLFAGFPVKAVRETGDKLLRADPFASQVNAGNVRLLRGDWNRAYIEELRQFTGKEGGKDDRVDASAGAFSALARPKVSWVAV